MTTVLDLIADAAPSADDVIYVVNDPGGTPGNRQVTIQNLATTIGTLLGVTFVATTGAQTVAGVKTFTSDPVIPDEAYGVGWNGVLEPPTKNAVYDKISSLPTLATATPAAISIYPLGSQLMVDFIGSASGVFSDSVFTVQDNVDATKQVMLQLSGLTTATTRLLTVPDADGTLVLMTAAQLLSSKTLALGTALAQSDTRTATVASDLLDSAVMELDFASAIRSAILGWSGQNVFLQAAIAGTPASRFAYAAPTIKNATAVALSLGLGRMFEDNSVVQADSAAVTLGAWVSFRAAPTWNVVGGGTSSGGTWTGFAAFPSFGAGHAINTVSGFSSFFTTTGAAITTLNAVLVNAPAISGGGSITTFNGVKINLVNVAGITTVIGFSNASNTINPPVARAITVAGDSLVSTTSVLATLYQLSNGTGGSITLTSAPTLPDGVADGQLVEFVNVGADDIVLQDQGTLPGSNLRLGAATRTLGPRDSIALRWNATVGDWLERSFVNVV